MLSRDPDCRLQILKLDGSDVDDVECAFLAEALNENKTVLSLSLSNNKIGTAELQNVATPNFVTGGEALGRMLVTNHTLIELDLRWNYIRLESACAIAESLIVNDSLRTLRLGNNGFGDLATQFLGMALKQNKVLRLLDLSFNSVTPKAAAVLQNGLVHNEVLDTLILDGNILGLIGARALVSAVQRASGESRVLQISFGESPRSYVSVLHAPFYAVPFLTISFSLSVCVFISFPCSELRLREGGEGPLRRLLARRPL
jgi:Ran GTPase-activating protein (RanGAP) involved in mRNA processing and transport